MKAFSAPAKLNLFLHVVGRRADGYHELQSVFVLIDRCDALEIGVRRDGQIHLLAPLAGVPVERDLAYRAARLLQQRAGCRLGADIRLHKRLPMGGGLGGGSSDAATVLLALNRLWGLDLSRQTLQDLALTLGADVPFFVFGRNALAEGIGERLTEVPIPPASYVVLVPPVSVSTPLIFADPGLTRDTPRRTMAALARGPGFVAEDLRNDLQAVAVGHYPVIGDYLDWLGRFGAARMSGSGACVFAGFGVRRQAEQVFAQRPAGMQGFVADRLSRHPFDAEIAGAF